MRIILPACLAFFLGSSFALAEPLRIGHLTDLTGIGAMLGTQTAFGISLAADELRAKRREIKVYTADHKMRLGEVVSAVSKLLELDRADIIVSDLTNPSMAAVGAVARKKKFYLVLAPTEKPLMEFDGAYRSFLDYRGGCSLLAEHFKSTGRKTALLGVIAEFTDLCLAGMKEHLDNFEEDRFNSGDDLRSGLLRLKQKGVEQVVFIGFEQDLISTFKRAADLKLKAVFGFPTLYLTPLIRQELGEQLKGSLVFGFRSLDVEFLEKVMARDPERDLTNIEFAAMAYMHTMQLAEAASACPDRSWQCLAAKLEQTRTPSLLHFQGWKNRIAQFALALYLWNGRELTPL